MLSVLTTDSRVTHVVTDENWRGSREGPIRSNNVYQGEIYDARMEIEGWTTSAFDDSEWAVAVEEQEFAGNEIVSWQPMNPIRSLELNSAQSITPILTADNETVYVFKFPQNAAGWAKLAVENCPANTTITMLFSEVLCGYGTTRWSPSCVGAGKPFGSVDQRNYHGDW